MSEIEVPLEQTLQDIEHAATHGSGHDSGPTSSSKWITWSALLSAGLAVLAAIGALRAGAEVNEAMLKQMRASDTWAYFQAKGIKASVLETRKQLLLATGKIVGPEIDKKIEGYAEDQKELTEKAEAFEKQSEAHFHRHEIFASSVTFYQVAIAITAIAVLSRRRRFLWVSGGFGVIGLWFLIQALLFNAGH